MEKNNTKVIPILIIIAVLVFGVTFVIIKGTEKIGSGGDNRPDTQISYEKAVDDMNKLYQQIQVNTLPPIKASVDLDEVNVEDSLPDISKYPAQVDNTTPYYVEIFSSTEKATVSGGKEDNDRWLVDVADAFNAAGFTVDDKPVSVRIRGIASGMGMDYISSGKYVPDAFSPSNELWGDCLKEMGIPITLAEEKLAGNVAGIVLSKKKNQEVIEKYGAVNIGAITEAVANNELALGYTNPLASSTGANFLMTTLYSFDKGNPLGDQAAGQFESFQANIPFVAYTTLQMKESAKSGVLDGFVFEYQQFVNSADLRAEYVFTPFGVRHDSPVYELGELSAEKKEILRMFIDFAKNEENQKLAEKYGFNGSDDYSLEISGVNGSLLSSAQKLWKEKKNAGREIIAVFVADVSGSMEGEPLNLLKDSLISGSKFIGNDCSVGLVTYSDEVNLALPIGKFDINQRSLFTGAVKDMSAGGGTATFNAIVVAEKMLYDAAADNPNAKLMLFVLSDGDTNVGFTLNATKDMIQGLRVPVYTIGYNADIDALKTISQINEAASINADTDDVVYKIQSLFKAEM